MGRHRDEPQRNSELRWSDWAFVFVVTIVAGSGAYAFVVFLFDKLGM